MGVGWALHQNLPPPPQKSGLLDLPVILGSFKISKAGSLLVCIISIVVVFM